MDEKCVICGVDITFLNRRKIANDEVICADCLGNAKTLTFKQILKLNNVTSSDIRKSIAESSGEEILNFKPTKKIGSYIWFDENQEKILLPDPIKSYVIKYKDVVSFDLIEDGETVTSGGIGRALVGGALFGEAGAIVGALTANKSKEFCTILKVALTVKNMENSIYFATFLNKKTKINSSAYAVAYQGARECISILQSICGNSEEIISDSVSKVDEIKQFKELLDDGIITQEEFDKKKKELLGL